MLPAPTTAEAYAPCVDQTFTIRQESGSPHTLTLTRVESIRDDAHNRSFSLYFAAPDSELPQGLHRLIHKTLGQFDLFLVPILSRGNIPCYQAIFNLLLDE